MRLAFSALVFVKAHLDFSKHKSRGTKSVSTFSFLLWQELALLDFAIFTKGIFQDGLRASSKLEPNLWFGVEAEQLLHWKVDWQVSSLKKNRQAPALQGENFPPKTFSESETPVLNPGNKPTIKRLSLKCIDKNQSPRLVMVLIWTSVGSREY